MDFGEKLEALPVRHGDVPPEGDANEAASTRPVSRRVRTRGRRDIGTLNNLPMIEQAYKLEGELCQCPNCQRQRDKIGEQISYTIEHIPASLLRIKHIQYKYACRHCEHNGDHPQIELAEKTGGSPIDKGMPGPGLLAYIATSKYSDYLPLHRLQTIFERLGFELDRSTMCLWMADVARLVRMWIYLGDDAQPYNVFAFTISRSRDGPKRFLKEFSGVLLADAYGGYDGIVLDQDLLRAGCGSHARRKFIEAEKTAPELARTILRLIKKLFDVETRAKHASAEDRLDLRRTESRPIVDALHALFIKQKALLLPKHPMAQAIQYAVNQWKPLTLFLSDGAVPIPNNLAEQQMKRIALLRKNALFVGTVRGGETAAILRSITSTCRRHDINPQAYLTQLLVGLPDTPISQLDQWLPEQWKKSQPSNQSIPPPPSSC